MHSSYFGEELWASGVGDTVEKKDDHMENGDGGQVGGTGGEGFSESTGWRHPDDCDNYEDIGGEDNQEATHLIESRNDKTCHLTDVRVRAGGRDDSRILTAKVMYDVRTTEGQLQKRTRDCQGTHSTPRVGSSNQEAAELRRHSNCVEQGVTNSHKPVIGHHC